MDRIARRSGRIILTHGPRFYSAAARRSQHATPLREIITNWGRRLHQIDAPRGTPGLDRSRIFSYCSNMQTFTPACLLVIGCAQSIHAEVEPAVSVEVPAELKKLHRLAGGEWSAKGENAPSLFHRFRPGPGEHSLWAHTRDSTKLDQWPKSETIYYWHPGEEVIKCMAPAAGGPLFDGSLRWLDESLQFEISYFIPNAEHSNYVSRWNFDGARAYDFTLYLKTSQGLNEIMNVNFEHSAQLRPLPEIAPPLFQATPKLQFLEDLTGSWSVTQYPREGASAQATMEFLWRAEGHVLTIRRTAPKGSALRSAEGMLFWHPEAKTVNYILVDDQGALLEGTVQSEGEAVVLRGQLFYGSDQDQIVESWASSGSDGLSVKTERMSMDSKKQVTQLQLVRPQ